MAAQINGHGPPPAGAITRTPSFAPISPVVKERVGDVATRLSEVERIIDDINTQSAKNTTRSPTMGDLQQEIGLLKKDVDETRAAQKKQIDGLRNNVKNELRDQITKTMKLEIEKSIRESVEAQVKVTVAEWGASEDTKKFVKNLKSLAQDNDALCREAQVKLDNSRSRHENSTLDEHADFETNLSKIKLPDGSVSKTFPRTMKMLFSYDENRLLTLFNEYGLQKLDTHLENLNRFLAFIGLRFSIPQQSLDLLDNPPEYAAPDVLESSNEEKTAEVSQAPPPKPVEEDPKETPEVQPDPEKPPQEPPATRNNPAQARPQGGQLGRRQSDSEKYSVQQDRNLQRQAEMELSQLTTRQPHAAGMNHWPQQNTPTHSARPTSMGRGVTNTHGPTHSQPSTPQEGKGVGGWLKSFAI